MGGTCCHEDPKNSLSTPTSAANEESRSARVENLDEKLSRMHSEVNEMKDKARCICMKPSDDGGGDRNTTPQKSNSAVGNDQRIIQLKSDLEELKMVLTEIRLLTENDLSDDDMGRIMTSDVHPQVTANSEEIVTTEVESENTISILEAQVKELRQILTNNIEKLLERGKRLDELQNVTEHLVKD